MSYRGWNEVGLKEVGLKEVGQALRQEVAISQDDRMPSLSPFTPINRYHAPFPYIDPLKTRHDRALDIDSVCDIPQHPAAEVWSQGSGGKPKFAAGRKGRAVSIGAVWKYTDVEDQIYDHRHQKKKQKTAPSKQRNLAQLPSITIPELLGQEEEALVVTEEETHQNDKNLQLLGSPLTTQPPIERRPRKKSAKLPPFKKPAITKPLVVSEPKVFPDGDPPFPRPVSNHPGLTTTQDVVKLSQTTLDKLAAFRYISSSASQPSKVFSENFRTDDHQRVHVQQGQYLTAVACHGSTDCGFPNDDLTFNKVSTSRNLPPCDVHDPAHITEVMQTLQQPTYYSECSMEILTERLLDNSFYAPVMNNGDSILRAATVDHVERELPENGTHELEEPPVHLPGKISTAGWQSSDYDEITSSEAKAVELTLVLDHGMHGNSMVGVAQEESNLVSMADDALRESQEPRNLDFLPNYGKSFGRLQSPPTRFNQSEALFSEELSQLSAGNCNKYEFAREVEEPAKDASEVLEVDEFDQDLDDADFLAVASDAAVETRVTSPKDQITAAHKQSKSLKISDGTSGRLHNHEVSSGVPNNSTVLPDKNAPRPKSSDIEDEFPLDEGDEEEMLNLSPVKIGVIETFQLPANLSYGAEEDQGYGEVYNSTLQSSLPNSVSSPLSPAKTRDWFRAGRLKNAQNDSLDPTPMVEDEDCDDVRGSQMTIRLQRSQNGISSSTARLHQSPPAPSDTSLAKIMRSDPSSTSSIATSSAWMSDDSHLYEPLPPFARPDFPALARDRSPIVGVSAQTFLRVCFRVGEMFKEGGRCSAMDQDAVIELFARVTFSCREPGTTKQNFEFADLWHDRPPFPSGVLANYKTTGLLETESRAFLGSEEGIMARCFGRLKKDSKSSSGWMLHVISIRVTDWEEIRWTRRIVSAGLVKSEK